MSKRRKVGKRGCTETRHAGDVDVGFGEVRFVLEADGRLAADLCFDMPTELIPDLIEALEDLKTQAFFAWSEAS